MKQTVAVVGTLDTKAQEIAYLRDLFIDGGFDALLVDVGAFAQDEIEPDIHRDEIASAGGVAIDELLARTDRRLAVETMGLGGARVLRRLYEEGAFQAVISIGGGTGTHIAAGAMRELPMGVPKLILSTVVARDMKDVVGGKDITLMHAVSDLIGLNFMTRSMLSHAAGAVMGMLRQSAEFAPERPVVALTSYGPLNECAFASAKHLTELGYEVVPFHAIGSGSMAMENLVEEGRVQGVLDLSLHEFADELHDGYCGAIGPKRLATAGRVGVPHVALPGGLDMVVLECVSHDEVPEPLRDRTFISHDFRSFVRSTAEDMRRVSAVIAERLADADPAPVFIIPNEGWSKADAPGGPFYAPEINKVFIDEITARLAPQARVVEYDGHINDEECSRLAVDELHRMMAAKAAGRSAESV